MEENRSVVDETVLGSVFSFSTGYSLVFCSSVAPIVYHSLRVTEKARVRYCSNPELLSTVLLIFFTVPVPSF